MDNIGIKGWFDITKINPDGTMNNFHVPNTVVADGKMTIASLIVNDVANPDAFDYLAIGSGISAVVVENSGLKNEVYGRINSSGAVIGSVCTFTGSFAISGTIGISEYGIFNSPSAGSMLARASGTTIDANNGDFLTVSYTLIVS